MKNSKFCGMGGSSSNAVYGMGFIGALVYYFQHATSLQDGLWGFIKAIFWPAFLIYKAIETLHI